MAGNLSKKLGGAELNMYQIIELCIALTTIILNSVAIVVILKRKYLHNPNNVMIAHLAAADAIAGFTVVPLAIVSTMDMEMDFNSCVLINSGILMFTNVQIIILVCVTAMRFLAVRFPFTYKYKLNTKRVMCLGGIAWIVALHLGIITFWWNKGIDNYGSKCTFQAVIPLSYLVYFHGICMFLIPILTMALVYTYIGLKLRNTKEVSSIHISVVIIAVYFVLNLPLPFINCLLYFEIDTPWDDDTGYTLCLGAILFARFNGIVNPFIYAFSNRHIKAAMPRRITVTMGTITSFATPSFRNFSSRKSSFKYSNKNTPRHSLAETEYSRQTQVDTSDCHTHVHYESDLNSRDLNTPDLKNF